MNSIARETRGVDGVPSSAKVVNVPLRVNQPEAGGPSYGLRCNGIYTSRNLAAETPLRRNTKSEKNKESFGREYRRSWRV